MKVRPFPAAGCLLAGLILSIFALTAWALEGTALDSARVAEASHDLLREPPVQKAMADRMASAIGRHLPGATPLDDATVGRAAVAAVHSSDFQRAFADGLRQVSDHVLSGVSGPIVLDNDAMIAAARTGVSSIDPALGPTLTTDQPMLITIPTDHLPDAQQWGDLVRVLARTLTPLALGMIVAGFALHPHRDHALKRIGRWALCLGVYVIVLFWVLPNALFEPLGGWTAVAGVVIGVGSALIVPALALMIVGVVAIVIGNRWETRQRHRTLSTLPHHAGRRAGAGWEARV